MDKEDKICEIIQEVIEVAGGEVRKVGEAKSGVGSFTFASVGMPRDEAGGTAESKTAERRTTRGAGRPKKVLPDRDTQERNIVQVPAGSGKKRRAEDPIQGFEEREDGKDKVEELQWLKDLVQQILQQNNELRNEQREVLQAVGKLQETVQELIDTQRKDKATIQSLQETNTKLQETNTNLQETNTKLHEGHQQEAKDTWASIVGSKSSSFHPLGVTSSSANPLGVTKELGKTAGTTGQEANPRRSRAEDDPLAITVITTKWMGDRTDYATIKEICQATISSFKVLKGVKISFLRPLPNDRISFVFPDKATADKARLHCRWLTRAMADARMKGVQWHPVKCDMVPKQVVLESEEDGKCILKATVAEEFATANSIATRDCTVMKSRWLSKANTDKTTGSIVLWLQNRSAAEQLLQRGTAIFGACGAFVSPYIMAENQGPCYKCNTYGHMQLNCRRTTRCGICSQGHATRDCHNKDNPKCPACAGAHVIMDSRRWPCHPRYHKGGGSGVTPTTQASEEMDTQPPVEC